MFGSLFDFTLWRLLSANFLKHHPFLRFRKRKIEKKIYILYTIKCHYHSFISFISFVGRSIRHSGRLPLYNKIQCNFFLNSNYYFILDIDRNIFVCFFCGSQVIFRSYSFPFGRAKRIFPISISTTTTTLLYSTHYYLCYWKFSFSNFTRWISDEADHILKANFCLLLFGLKF